MIHFLTFICLMKYNFILIGQIICWSVGFLLAKRCIFGLRVSDRIILELQIFSVCSNSLKVPGLCGKIGTKWKQNQKNIFFNDFWFTASNVKHNILWWLISHHKIIKVDQIHSSKETFFRSEGGPWGLRTAHPLHLLLPHRHYPRHVLLSGIKYHFGLGKPSLKKNKV